MFVQKVSQSSFIMIALIVALLTSCASPSSVSQGPSKVEQTFLDHLHATSPFSDDDETLLIMGSGVCDELQLRTASAEATYLQVAGVYSDTQAHAIVDVASKDLCSGTTRTMTKEEIIDRDIDGCVGAVTGAHDAMLQGIPNPVDGLTPPERHAYDLMSNQNGSETSFHEACSVAIGTQ